MVIIPSSFSSTFADKEFTVEKPIPPFKGQIKLIEHNGLRALAMPLLTVYADPSDHLVYPPSSLEGVGRMSFATLDGGLFYCSSSLLNGGKYLLTAAHCTTDQNGVIDFDTENPFSKVEFLNDDGGVTITEDITKVIPHPDYDGCYLCGNDFALVKLANPISGLATFGIDENNSDDLGLVTKSGYGMSGTGKTGATFSDGKQRHGENEYDAFHDQMMSDLDEDYVPGAVLQYDFDNGKGKNDAFGRYYGLKDTGLVPIEREVNSARGDSGSPSINAQGCISGIASYGITFLGGNVDARPGINSSWGEFSGDGRVSHYSPWIINAINSEENNSLFDPTCTPLGAVSGDPPGEDPPEDPEDPPQDPPGGNVNGYHITSCPNHDNTNLDTCFDNDSFSYANRQTIHIVAQVVDEAGNGVQGISVNIQFETPRGKVFATDPDPISDANGFVDSHFKINSNRDGTGTYDLSVTGQGSCADPCNDFIVN